MNWRYDSITTLAAVIQAISALVTLVIAGFAVRWARAQAEAGRANVEKAQEAIQASHRPIVVPANNDISPPIKNLGAGPALNVVIRAFFEDRIHEAHLSTIGANEQVGGFGYHVTGTLGWSIPEHLTPVMELLYTDVFGRYHRTIARYQNGRWIEIRFDHGGDPKNYVFFLEGTELYNGPDRAGVYHVKGWATFSAPVRKRNFWTRISGRTSTKQP